MQEIWKDITGYEGLYQVSSLGNLRHIKNGRCRALKQHLTPKGYYVAFLCKGGVRRSYLVHRIIAREFIPNPRGLNEIDHIDADRANNSLSNLRWVTHLENMKHAGELGHMRRLNLKRGRKDRDKTVLFMGRELVLGTFQEICRIHDENSYTKLHDFIAHYTKRSNAAVKRWAYGLSVPRNESDKKVVSRTLNRLFHLGVTPESLFPSN